ncbi:MAG: Mov34/MPN/PAD-1 family protein, partial [Chloroflexota bacterium]|nr:Mov34/MPN/PAD-1 family protein [Chloroflexota bacterium]
MTVPVASSVALRRSIADAIVAQAREELPNEACGLVVGSGPAVAGGVALRYEACRNADASPVRYTIDSDDLIRLAIAVDDA